MKTVPISVKIRRIFERHARAWPAKLVRRHFMCAERQENHQRLLVLRVPHVQRAFRADFRRFCSENMRDFASRSMRNRRATNAQRAENMCTVDGRSFVNVEVDRGSSCDRAVPLRAENPRVFR